MKYMYIDFIWIPQMVFSTKQIQIQLDECFSFWCTKRVKSNTRIKAQTNLCDCRYSYRTDDTFCCVIINKFFQSGEDLSVYSCYIVHNIEGKIFSLVINVYIAFKNSL